MQNSSRDVADALFWQDAEAYQRLLDIAARAYAQEGIRQGLEDAKQGKVRPARKFFEDFEAGHGIQVNLTACTGRLTLNIRTLP